MYNQNFTATGLSTTSVSIPQAGPIFIKGNISLPILSQGGSASTVVTTVNQNGSAIYTGPAGAEGFYVTANAASNDTIAVVFSSSTTNDAVINNVKATFSIGSGQ